MLLSWHSLMAKSVKHVRDKILTLSVMCATYFYGVCYTLQWLVVYSVVQLGVTQFHGVCVMYFSDTLPRPLCYTLSWPYTLPHCSTFVTGVYEPWVPSQDPQRRHHTSSIIPTWPFPLAALPTRPRPTHPRPRRCAKCRPPRCARACKQCRHHQSYHFQSRHNCCAHCLQSKAPCTASSRTTPGHPPTTRPSRSCLCLATRATTATSASRQKVPLPLSVRGTTVTATNTRRTIASPVTRRSR